MLIIIRLYIHHLWNLYPFEWSFVKNRILLSQTILQEILEEVKIFSRTEHNCIYTWSRTQNLLRGLNL